MVLLAAVERRPPLFLGIQPLIDRLFLEKVINVLIRKISMIVFWGEKKFVVLFKMAGCRFVWRLCRSAARSVVLSFCESRRRTKGNLVRKI